jgi:hypothetical protein
MNDLVDALAVAASKGPFTARAAATPTDTPVTQGSLFDA